MYSSCINIVTLLICCKQVHKTEYLSTVTIPLLWHILILWYRAYDDYPCSIFCYNMCIASIRLYLFWYNLHAYPQIWPQINASIISWFSCYSSYKKCSVSNFEKCNIYDLYKQDSYTMLETVSCITYQIILFMYYAL